MKPLFSLKAALVLMAGAWIAGGAQAAYPDKPVHFIVPFSPGGGAESTARIIAAKLGPALGQPIVVETRPGAGSSIGTQFVAQSRPDGYTILLNTNASTILPNMQKLPWDPVKDLMPVSLVATYPLAVIAHPSTPATTLPELVAYAKAHPGKLSYGSSGAGGPTQLGAELFKREAGVDILHVPYKGNAPATLAVLGGEVNLTFDSLVGPLANIRAGRLRALAVTGKKRSPLLPDVPTVTETGVAKFSYKAWNGVSVPKGTPPEIVQRLNAEIVRIVAMPEVNRQLAELGYEPMATTPAQMGERVAADLARNAKVIKDMNLRLDE